MFIVLYSKAIINLSKPTASRLVKVSRNHMCIFDMCHVITCGCWFRLENKLSVLCNRRPPTFHYGVLVVHMNGGFSIMGKV